MVYRPGAAAVATMAMYENIVKIYIAHVWYHAHCIGLEGSPDLKAAKAIAKHFGTLHSSFTFAVQRGNLT